MDEPADAAGTTTLEQLIVTPTRHEVAAKEQPANATRIGPADIERVAATHVSEICRERPGPGSAAAAGRST